jgi:hypothetical protein
MTGRSIALSDELIRRALRPASDVDAPPDLLDAILADVAVTRPRRRIIAWPWTPEAPGQPWRSTRAGRLVWALAILGLLAGTVLGVLVALAQLRQPPGPFGGRILINSDDNVVLAIALDGTEPNVIPDLMPAGNPVWSPDGTKFVIAARRDESVRLEIRGSDGEVDTVLPKPTGGGAIGRYDWSPDGQRIAAIISVRGVDRLLIHDLRRPDDDPIDLTPLGVAVRGSFIKTPWSPDGRSIAFVAQALWSDAPRALWVGDVATGGARVIVEKVSGFTIGFFEPTAVWSPDGTLIAFDGEGLLGNAIFVVQPDGRGLRRIVPDLPLPSTPQWSPDGKLLLVENRKEGGVAGTEPWVADVDDGGAWRVISSGSPRGWSPDGWVVILSPGCGFGPNRPNVGCPQDLLLIPPTGVARLDDPRIRRLLSAGQVDALVGPTYDANFGEFSWPGLVPAGGAHNP